MDSSQNRYYALFALCMIVLMFEACTAVRPSAVKNYRRFPEYGGYLPITDEEKMDTARADWVLPVKTPEGKADFRLPGTAHEAEKRVRKGASKELLEAVAIAPLQIAAIPLFPIFMLLDPLDHAFMSQRSQEVDKQLSELAGLKVDIRVVDAKGNPISNATIFEFSTPFVFARYSDEHNLRSFGPPQYELYAPPDNLPELLARYFPVHMGKSIQFHQGSSRDFGSIDYRILFGGHFTNDAGRALYASQAFMKFVRHEKDGWRWILKPDNLSLHYLVWAPGCKPVAGFVSRVKPGTTISIAVVLTPLPDGERAVLFTKQFKDILEKISQGNDWRDVEGSFYCSMVEQISGWIEDDKLPSYCRWNAYELLKSLQQATRDTEIKDYLDRIEAKTKTLSPYLNEGLKNPWALDRGFQEWLSNITRISYSSSSSPSQLAGMIEVAREILKKAEAIDPHYPVLDSLRAAVAMSEGDKEKALILSPYLDHREFFTLYYHNKCRIVQPSEGGF